MFKIYPGLKHHRLAPNNVFTLKMKGKYKWELLVSIDNTENKLESLKREVALDLEVSLNYDDFAWALKSEAAGRGLTLDLGFFDVISITGGNLNTKVMAAYEKMCKSKKDSVHKATRMEPYEVGAGALRNSYQLVFDGPGIHYKTETTSPTNISKTPDQIIEVKGFILPVLLDIEVVHATGSEPRPCGAIREERGYSPDINEDRGGKHVWLKPIWTNEMSEGATGIQFLMGRKMEEDYVNLEVEDKDFRYLKMEWDPESKFRITDVALWRRKGEGKDWPQPDKEFKFKTGDINEGREGGELYVVWNGKEIQEIPR